MLTTSFGCINLRDGGEDAGVPAASIGGSILTLAAGRSSFPVEPAWSTNSKTDLTQIKALFVFHSL
jgi:hypothetical protein